MALIGITPVQKRSGGGLLGKIAGGLHAAIGVGEAVGGIATGNPLMAAKGISDTAESTAGILSKEPQAPTTPLQTVSNSLDNKALQVTQAKDAVNASDISEPERLKYIQHFDETLNALNQRRKSMNQGIG